MNAPQSLFPGPSAGFDEPVEMLEACHQRVLRMLALLERLAAHLTDAGADASAQQAAIDLKRYFDVAAVHHHDDEERHVLPLLGRLGRHALARQLFDEHRALSAAWTRIRAELDAVQAGRQPEAGHEPGEASAARGAREAREVRWREFAARYRAHIALEEGTVHPLLHIALDEPMRRAMGEDMARRRGAVLPGAAPAQPRQRA
jgi:hemerythrin-like domain-containing protein